MLSSVWSPEAAAAAAAALDDGLFSHSLSFREKLGPDFGRSQLISLTTSFSRQIISASKVPHRRHHHHHQVFAQIIDTGLEKQQQPLDQWRASVAPAANVPFGTLAELSSESPFLIPTTTTTVNWAIEHFAEEVSLLHSLTLCTYLSTTASITTTTFLLSAIVFFPSLVRYANWNHQHQQLWCASNCSRHYRRLYAIGSSLVFVFLLVLLANSNSNCPF